MDIERRAASLIVRCRTAVLIAAVLLTAACAFTIGRTKINYDLSRYLSDDTVTKKSLLVMEKEFGVAEQLRVMFADADGETFSAILEELRALPEVRIASHDPQQDTAEDGGKTWRLVTLTLRECDSIALAVRLREMFPGVEHCVGGGPAQQKDVQDFVAAEIPAVMALSVAVVAAVLLLTSHAWLEGAVLLAVLASSIVVNMGTNFIFRDVSFITFAVCAILQLALSIDYAIMLLHTYHAQRDRGMGAEAAMAEALAQCFLRIASSAATTAAGLLSLLFMSFTIGFDIGVVLTKGIFISMLGVFLLMPAVALLMEKPLAATRHRPIRLGGERLSRAVRRAAVPIACVLAAACAAGAYLNSRCDYLFTDPGALDSGESVRVEQVFGSSHPLALLVPGGDGDEDIARQRELARRLESLTLPDGRPAVSSVTAFVTTGAKALEYLTADDVSEMTGMPAFSVRLFFLINGFSDTVRADRLLDAAQGIEADGLDEMKRMLDTARELFIGPTTSRMLAEPAFSAAGDDLAPGMEAILGALRGVYGEDFSITGSYMSTYDIERAFRGDLMRVNLITLAAILTIVAVSFRSLRVGAVLVFVIEGAIWITMGISRLLDEPIFFISYLICLSIQMGATIDYGILLCDQYLALRREGRDRADSLDEALKKALPTILTSGTILVSAGFLVGEMCSVYYISSIGSLVARGAAVSSVLVLTLLPALLFLFDRWIARPRGRQPR